MPNLALNFKGDLEISAALLGLAPEIRVRAIPAALKKAGAPIVKLARQRVPTDRTADPAGTLKKSIGLEMRKPRRGPAYVAVGARRGFARAVTRPIIIAGEIKGAAVRKADPANYAHLVEFGHVVVVPKKGASIRRDSALLASGRSVVDGRPFLRPAMLEARAAVKAILIAELAKAQARYLQRKAKNTGRAVAGAILAA